MTKTKTNSPRKKATVGILVAGFLSASFGFALSQATNTREVRAYQSVEQYYANANTSSGSALLTSLQSITTKGSDVGSYDDLFETYRSSDVKDGYLVDMYSNTTRYTVDQKRCGNYKNEGDCWNREHSTPKSWWGGSKSNQGADPFILYPTDGKINGMRSSYPFGEVKTIEKASNNNYSLLGSADNSLYPYSGTVFEPADEWKGDLARSAFYTRARWSASYSWSSGGGNVIYSGSASNNFGLTDYAVKLYTAWSNLDPVDEWELRRNEAIYAIQGNRNPFIDHPEYANIIWGGTTYTGGGATTPPNTITLNPASSSIAVGATVSLSVSVDSGSSQVTWSSNKTNVATVSGGTVTGIGAGTATITATSTLDTSVKGTATITVKSLSTLSLSGTATNKSYSAGQSFNPAGLTITATYSDSSTANVTSSVVWTPDPLTEGTTSVTGTYGGKTVSVSGLTVTAPVGYTLVTSASQLTSGDSLIFAHTSSSSTAGALDGTFLNPVTNATFSSDTITDAGSSLIFTLGGSSNNWTFTNNGQTLKSSAAKNVNFNSGTATWSISVASGGDATVTNTTSSYGSLQYNTGAPRFTTYTSSQAAIQLYRQGGGQSSVAVTGVSLNTNSLNLVVGNNSTLTATVAPTNATNKNVTWSSSDTSVATVSSTGVISALAAGSATITVNTLDGGFTDTCALTVVAPLPEIILVTGVTLNKSTLPLQVEVSEILIATVNPSDATNKDVTWSSSDTSVVSVSDGVVTALKAGTAVITVTTVDGGFFDTCEVEVNEVDEPIDPQNPPDQSSNEGCGGSIAITSMVIAGFSVVGFIFVILKKRFSK